MFPNYNGSPLHHSVLYRPMMDASTTTTAGVGGPGGYGGCNVGGGQDDNILDGDALPSSTGISRQQLINRYSGSKNLFLSLNRVFW